MKWVVDVKEGSCAQAALDFALRVMPDGGEIVLVHVSPSARATDTSRAEHALEKAYDRAAQYPRLQITRRLEIGNSAERVAAVAEEVGADRIVLGAHDAGSMPYLERVSPDAERLMALTQVPVVLITSGGEILHNEELAGT
jgi:nucleotide-binding universal stress UspA family protein